MNNQIVGGIAQLGERLLCKQEVNGSIPFISTTGRKVWNGYCGESARLISVRSVVRVHLSPPAGKPAKVNRKFRKGLGNDFEEDFVRNRSERNRLCPYIEN